MLRKPFWCRCAQLACVCAVGASLAGVFDDAVHLKVSKLSPVAIPSIATTSGTATSTVVVNWQVVGRETPKPPPIQYVRRPDGPVEQAIEQGRKIVLRGQPGSKIEQT